MPDNNPSSWTAASGRLAAAQEAAAAAKERLTAAAREGFDDYPPPGKSGQIAFGCYPYKQDPAPYIRTLQTDLANFYYWSGNFLYDWIFFNCNWHPILGMLLCHPHHPWTKVERLKMFIISTALTMAPAIAISDKVESSFPEKEVELKKNMTMTFTILFVTIPDIIIGVVLYQISIASTRCPTNGCICCLETVSKFCMNCSLVIGAVACLIAFFQLKDHPNHFVDAIKPLAMGKLYSAVTWFPLWFLLPCGLGFCCQWRTEKKAEEEKAAKMLNNNNNVEGGAE